MQQAGHRPLTTRLTRLTFGSRVGSVVMPRFRALQLERSSVESRKYST
jgi:hypothetical protein